MTVSQAAVDDWHAAVRLQEHLRAGHRATPVSGLVSPAGEPAFARLDGALDVSLGWQGLTAMHTDTMGLALTYGLDEFRVRVHCPTWLQVMVMHIGFGVVTNLVAPSWARDRRPD